MPEAPLPATPTDLPPIPVSYSALLAYGEWASELGCGRSQEFRLAVDNTGTHGWHHALGQPEVSLEAVWKPTEQGRWRSYFSGGAAARNPVAVPMRGDVPSGQRGYFVWEMNTPAQEGRYRLEFCLRFRLDGHSGQKISLGGFHLRVGMKNIDQPRRYLSDETPA